MYAFLAAFHAARIPLPRAVFRVETTAADAEASGDAAPDEGVERFVARLSFEREVVG